MTALLLIVGACSIAPVGAFPRLPRSDLHGDPLPDGAIARFGTSRLRADCAEMAFSKDGKVLIGNDGLNVRVWDAQTGRLSLTRQLDNRNGFRVSRSEDGQTLIVARGALAELWDVNTREKVDVPMPRDCEFIEKCAVSNNRRIIVIAWKAGVVRSENQVGFKEPVYHLRLWDTSSRKFLPFLSAETGLVWLGFSPDGKKCVTTGGPNTKVWDTATGDCLWSVPNYNAEETHFTPDGKYLIAAPGGGQSKWHIWDADTGKRAKDLHVPKDYVWMFAVSPDGGSLLLPTDSDYILWDMKSGRERHRWPVANQAGRGVFAPDGRSVVTHDTILRRWDLKTGKNIYADVSALGHIAPVRKMFFAPDGKRLVSIGDDRTARVWDVATSKLLRTIRIDLANIDAWAMAPDANTLVGVDSRMTMHRWPIAEVAARSSIDLREAQKLDIGLRAREIQVTPDGTLAVLGAPRVPEYRLLRFSFSSWDSRTGKHIRWGGDPGKDYRGDYTRMSPDGSLVASGDGLYDTRTGLKRTFPASPIGAGGVPTFSPDSRLLAASSNGIRVWEAATGRMLEDLPRGSGGSDHIAISPDGRRLACLGSERLTVWDHWTGRAVVEIPSPKSWLSDGPWLTGGLAFSPDGRSLAVGYADGAILLWSIPSPTNDAKWTEADIAALWNDLGHESPANAYPAVWQLASRPADAVRMLSEKYPLIEAATPDEWTKLIAALDSERFAAREAAAKRLRELGRAAVKPLRKALDDKPSPEQIQRIENLLAELDPRAGRPHGEDLRAIRAVAVLEACGGNEARQLLEQWAERGSTLRLAHDAFHAIERLRLRR